MVNIIASTACYGDPRRATGLKSKNTMYGLSGKWLKGSLSAEINAFLSRRRRIHLALQDSECFRRQGSCMLALSGKF